MSTQTMRSGQDALNEADINLLHVRSLLDLLHEAVCHGGSIVIEQTDEQSWVGLFHMMLRKVDETRELIQESCKPAEAAP